VSLAVQTYRPDPMPMYPPNAPRDIESLLAGLPALQFEAE
jgi:hypothetical protein